MNSSDGARRRKELSLEPLSFEQTYYERQSVVVVKDEILEAERRAFNEIDAVDESEGWEKVQKTALEIVKSQDGPTIELAQRGWRKVRELLEKDIIVRKVSETEAGALGLKFPAGGARPDQLYVANPVDPHRYYSVGSFHEEVLTHKLREARKLMRSLGASNIQIEATRRATVSRGGKLGFEIPLKRVKGSAEREQVREFKRRFEGDLEPEGEPALPPASELCWYPLEDDWQEMAESRLSGSLKKHTLEVFQRESYGINSEFAAKVKGIGLDGGTTFEDQLEVGILVHATFSDGGGGEPRIRPMLPGTSSAGRKVKSSKNQAKE